MREFNIRLSVPRWPRNLAGNLIGVAGLLAVAYYVGALLNNFEWSGLIAGVFAVALAFVHANQGAAAEGQAVEPTPIRKPVTAAVKSA